MRTFEQIDKLRFRLSKPDWSEHDRLSAECISLTKEGDTSYIGDVRYVWPEALDKFLFHVFTSLFSNERIAFKTSIYKQIGVMYRANRKTIRELYISKLDYDRELYKHQKNAVVDMIPHRFNFLSFDMGLGKTITSATLSKLLKIRRTIIIAPAGVKWNWYHDMTDDWGYDPLYWTILDAKRTKCINAFIERFVVINYEMIEKYWEHLTKSDVGHIIIDEVHLAKNHTTKRYKGVAKLINHFPKARVTMLSGTPITNRVNDLFAYFKMSGHPLGRNHSAFMNRYVLKSDGYRGKIIGAKNMEELTMRQSNFMIRKKAEECLDLPPLIINKYYLEETEITAEYMQVLEEMYQNKMAMEEARESKNIQQLEGAISANVHSLNRILATAKASKVIELIDKIRSEGRKVIVFATYKSALSALEEHYQERCVKIDGSVDSHKRSILIERYKSDPKCEVFLGNVKAAGVGINLVNSSDVIFMNFPFTPDDLEQPQKRSHRIGQKSSVNVYYTIVKNSIDEHIYNIIVDKSQDINNVLDKGKKGVVNYGNVMNKIFKNLLDNYADATGKKRIETNKFEKV
jgi:SWI/SNF-related matrix-associated actin-dependent regulator of chromatin subfamily A-like protein 1